MNNKFRAVIERLKKVLKREPTLERFLVRKLGKKTFNAFLLRSPDRRHWLEHAANALRFTTEELLQEFAQFGAWTLLLRINSDTSQAPLSDHERQSALLFGYVPIIQRGEVVGIAAVDPVRVEQALPHYKGNIPFFLSSWEEIQRVLTGSPSTGDFNASATKASHDERSEGRKVLEKILDAAADFDLSALEFHTEGNATYTVHLCDGKKAAGAISGRYARLLSDYLHEIVSNSVTPSITYGNLVFNITKKSSADFTAHKQLTVAAIVESKPPVVTASIHPSVLLVDDNKSFLTIVTKYLKENGITVTTATNGDEALEQLRSSPDVLPAVMVCDLHMPNKNGFELIQQVKQDPQLSAISIISLTSDKDIEAEISLLNLGIAAFISKNEDPRILLVHVKRLLTDAFGQKKAA